jgi:uncharacterized protein YoxC
VSEPVSIETRVSRNTNDIEALYGLIQGFEGRTRVNFAKVNQRFDDLDGKVDSIVGRVDGLDGKVGGIVGRVDGLDSKVDGLDGKVDGLDGKVDGLIGRVDGLEGKVDGIAGQLGEVLELLRKQN